MAQLAAILTADVPSQPVVVAKSEPRKCPIAQLRSNIQSKIDHAAMPPVYKIPLIALNCQFGMVKRKHTEPMLLKDAIKYERRKQQANVTVVFAIRQPG